jgi:hypothetical protein
MVYTEASRKTFAFMALALCLSLGIVTFFTEDLSTPTARVVDGGAASVAGQGWLVFVLGIFIGGLLIGTYFYIAHIEAKRHE